MDVDVDVYMDVDVDVGIDCMYSDVYVWTVSVWIVYMCVYVCDM